MFKTQEPKNHTLFSGTYILYYSRPNKSVPLSGVCSWYTAILGSRNHVEVKKAVQSVRPVTVVTVYYVYGNNISLIISCAGQRDCQDDQNDINSCYCRAHYWDHKVPVVATVHKSKVYGEFPQKRCALKEYSQTSLIQTPKGQNKCPLYRGVRIIEVGNVGFQAFLGPNELSVVERCPYYRGVGKERLDCNIYLHCTFLNIQ